MGIAALDCLEGRSIQHNSKMKVFVIAALVAAASADPWYGYGGYGYHGYGGRSYVGPTTWGLGKRSADSEPEAAPEAEAEADPHYGYYGQYAWPSAYGYGYGLGLYGPGIAGHPTGTSYVARSPQGARYLGKRSAEAEPHYGYGHLGYGAGYGYGLPAGYAHFGPGHYLGKREAEAEPYYGYCLGYYGRGYYGGYGHRYGYGYGYYG